MVKAGNPPNPGRNFSAGGGSQQSPGPSFQLLPPFCIFFFRAAMIALKLQPNNWRKSGSDPKHSKTAYDCCQDARPPATWVPLMKSCGRICERQAVSGKGFTYGCQWLFDVYPIDCLSSLISKKKDTRASTATTRKELQSPSSKMSQVSCLFRIVFWMFLTVFYWHVLFVAQHLHVTKPGHFIRLFSANLLDDSPDLRIGFLIGAVNGLNPWGTCLNPWPP